MKKTISSPAEFGWFDEVPHPAIYEFHDGEENQPTPPHPGDLPADVLAELRDGPDYSASEVRSVPIHTLLDPIWWSLGNVAEFIEATSQNDDPDRSVLFTGLPKVEQAIRSGKLLAYGSIDAAPVSPIPTEVWTEFLMIPSNIALSSAGTVTYEVSVRSVRSYRPSALHDHSFPAGETVPSALSSGGEPGYHRIISNPFVKELEARKLFAAKIEKSKQRRIGDKQRRIADTLNRLTIKGTRIYPDRAGFSFAEITRAVLKDWRKQDARLGKEVMEYNLPSEEQAVRRFYNSDS